MDATVISAIISGASSIIAAVVPPLLSRSAAAKILEIKRVAEEFEGMVTERSRHELRCALVWEVHCAADNPWSRLCATLAIGACLLLGVNILFSAAQSDSVPAEQLRLIMTIGLEIAFLVAVPVSIILYYEEKRKYFASLDRAENAASGNAPGENAEAGETSEDGKGLLAQMSLWIKMRTAKPSKQKSDTGESEVPPQNETDESS